MICDSRANRPRKRGAIADAPLLFVGTGEFENAVGIAREEKTVGLDENGDGLEAGAVGGIGAVGGEAIAFAVEMQKDVAECEPEIVSVGIHAKRVEDRRHARRAALFVLALDFAAEGLRGGLNIQRGDIDFKCGIAKAVVLADGGLR